MPPKGWRKSGEGNPVNVNEMAREAVSVADVVADVVVEEKAVPEIVEKAQPVKLTQIEESRKSLLSPLPEGMAFFEAPDGYIIVAEESRDNVFYRAGNGGDGMWINKRRV